MSANKKPRERSPRHGDSNGKAAKPQNGGNNAGEFHVTNSKRKKPQI
jgi:hypothetical protein